jgi:hypothetical protein
MARDQTSPYITAIESYLDLWDIGEFYQKATRRTKWGSLEEFQYLMKVAHDYDMEINFHAVLNHKAHANEIEKCRAIQCFSDGVPFNLSFNRR